MTAYVTVCQHRSTLAGAPGAAMLASECARIAYAHAGGARMAREDTFIEARKHLQGLSDEELEARFWELSRACVDPMVELARTHTSPSIERSVLMRMGIDSLTCKAVVAECETRGLLAHGAGHVVLEAMRAWDVGAPAAAVRLAAGEGWDIAAAKWGAR